MADTKPPGGPAPAPDGAASTAPFWTLAASLAGLAAFFVVRPLVDSAPAFRPRTGVRFDDYWTIVLAAFVPYAWAVHAAIRGMRLPAPALLGAAAVIAVLFVPAPPQQSQDVYQYLVYGEMASEGLSPYADLPSDLGGPSLDYSSWPDTPSVYGPLWTAASQFSVAVGSLTASLLVLKSIAAALGVAVAVGLHRAASLAPDRPPWATPTFAVVVFAFNPMVVTSTGLGAHADVAVAAAFAWAAVFERRSRAWPVTGLLAAAALVKPYAALALAVWLIVLWRRRGVRPGVAHAFASLGLAAAAYAPYWRGTDTFRGLGEVGERVSTTLLGSVVRLAAGRPDSADAGGGWAGGVGRAVAFAALLAGLAWVLARTRRDPDPWRPAAAISALYVLVTPWFLYWHLLGAFALAVVAADAAVVAATTAFSATSLVVLAPPLAVFGGRADLLLQTGLRYAPALGAWGAARRRYTRRRAGSRGDPGGLRGGDRAPAGARSARRSGRPR